jgi:hypothetical protein
MGSGASTDNGDPEISETHHHTGDVVHRDRKSASDLNKSGGRNHDIVRQGSSAPVDFSSNQNVAPNKELSSDKLKSMAMGQKGYKDEYREYDNTLAKLHQRQEVTWGAAPIAPNATNRKDAVAANTSVDTYHSSQYAADTKQSQTTQAPSSSSRQSQQIIGLAGSTINRNSSTQKGIVPVRAAAGNPTHQILYAPSELPRASSAIQTAPYMQIPTESIAAPSSSSSGLINARQGVKPIPRTPQSPVRISSNSQGGNGGVESSKNKTPPGIASSSSSSNRGSGAGVVRPPDSNNQTGVGMFNTTGPSSRPPVNVTSGGRGSAGRGTAGPHPPGPRPVAVEFSTNLESIRPNINIKTPERIRGSPAGRPGNGNYTTNNTMNSTLNSNSNYSEEELLSCNFTDNGKDETLTVKPISIPSLQLRNNMTYNTGTSSSSHQNGVNAPSDPSRSGMGLAPKGLRINTSTGPLIGQRITTPVGLLNPSQMSQNGQPQYATTASSSSNYTGNANMSTRGGSAVPSRVGSAVPSSSSSGAYEVKETNDVKRNRVKLPPTLTHAKPTTGNTKPNPNLNTDA